MMRMEAACLWLQALLFWNEHCERHPERNSLTPLCPPFSKLLFFFPTTRSMGVFGCDNSCWGWTKMAMPLPRQEFRQASHPCLLVCLALQLLGLCWCREQWHSKYCSPVFTKKILSLSFTSTLFIKYAKYLSYYRPCIYTLYIIAQYKTHPMQTEK